MIHRIKIEFLSQGGVGRQGQGIDLRRNAGERLNEGVPNLVACHSFSGAWSARSKAVRNEPAPRPSTAR